MALFNDIFCQICDRFYTKEQWNKHLYSSRHLHREEKLMDIGQPFFHKENYLETKVINLRKLFGK